MTEHAVIAHWAMQVTHFSHILIYTKLYSSHDDHA